MTVVASAVLTWSTLLKLVVGALVAGLGVTVAFSLLIYCAERGLALRREGQRTTAALFQAAALSAGLTVMGLVTYGLILMTSKPK